MGKKNSAYVGILKRQEKILLKFIYFHEFLQVDREISEELRSTGSFEVMSLDTDEAEHSIEMHLPYIAKMMAPKVIISHTKKRFSNRLKSPFKRQIRRQMGLGTYL